MSAFQLARTAYVCVGPQGAVFLDVARDAYFGLDAQQSRSLAPVVQGWPDVTTQDMEISAEAWTLAVSLRAKGILVDAPEGQAADLQQIQSASEELFAWEDAPATEVRLSHVLNFLRAFFTVALLLRMRLLRVLVSRARSRRHTCFNGLDHDGQIRNLVAAYTTIRPFVFARRERCLLDSLTLLEFLGLYRFAPSWVIGVQIRPFAAHSWLQMGHCVLNGTPAFVRSFYPILVV